MDTVLQRKPFLRPPSQYEKMCLSNLAKALLISSSSELFSPVSKYVPSSNPYHFGVTDLIFIAISCMIWIPCAIFVHMDVKCSLISFNKLHVFGLYACAMIGTLIPELFLLSTVSDSQFLPLLFIFCKISFIQFLIGSLYTWVYVKDK